MLSSKTFIRSDNHTWHAIFLHEENRDDQWILFRSDLWELFDDNTLNKISSFFQANNIYIYTYIKNQGFKNK